MYRTLCSTFILIMLFKLYELIETTLPVLEDWHWYILFVLLLLLFLFPYRKQTDYVGKRANLIG